MKTFMIYINMFPNIFLPYSGPKVPLSLPAPDRECCIFGLARQKNRIHTMGANKECLRSHVCQFTRDLGHSLLLLPRCVIYYFAYAIIARVFDVAFSSYICTFITSSSHLVI